jgi:hypothetical protein
MVAAHQWWLLVDSSRLLMAVAHLWRCRSWQWLVHGGHSFMVTTRLGVFMVVAHSWRWLVHGGGSFMAVARSWQPLTYSSCSFMMAASSWRPLWTTAHLWWPLIHGGCYGRPLIYGGRSSMAVTRPWRLLVYSGCSSMHNCTILKGNSSCGLYDENHVISNHSHVGGDILPRSILHSAKKHFAFCHRVFRMAF